MKNQIFLIALLTFCIICYGFSANAQAPDHIVIVVLDQMRPDYIERYNLPHLKNLQKQATTYPKAEVGHFPSITLMAHPVLATGVFPKTAGYNTEIFEDTQGILGKPGQWYDAGELSLKQFRKIFKANLPQPTALKLIKKKLKGKILAIGQKDYATFTMGGLDADRVVTLGNKIADGPYKGWRGPIGYKVPDTIAKPVGGRFYVKSSEKYGSEQELKRLDDRHVPGFDTAHQGGDVWTMDATLQIINDEPDWRVLMVTMSGIDAIGHAFGEMDNPSRQTLFKNYPYNLEKVLKIADEQVGRLMHDLQEKGLWDKTLFLVTADHGGLSAIQNFYGDRNPGGSDDNSMYGEFANNQYLKPSKTAKAWLGNGIRFATFDTANRFWFEEDKTETEIATLCPSYAKMPGAVSSYRKVKTASGFEYRLCHANNPAEIKNAQSAIVLLNTMADEDAPDIVVPLAKNTGYGNYGDHGGLQENSMRIPMILHKPAQNKAETNHCPIRLIDVMPTVLQELEITLPNWLEGKTCQ